MIIIPTKDIGVEVVDCFRDINYKWSLEEGYEDYIKREFGIDG